LPLLFVAAALFYIACGIGTEQVFFKLGPSGMVDSAHMLVLVAMPLAGALLDPGGRGCRVVFPVLAVLVFAAPRMVFTSESVWGMAREGLYAVITIGRLAVLMVTLLLAERLLLRRKRLPLLLALAYVLFATAMVGVAIARMSGAALAGGIALALALAFAFLAFRLRAALADLPVARDEDVALMPDAGARDSAEPEALDAFAVSYGLSKQEMTVMGMLAQQHSTEAIAKTLGVTDNTVHTYVRRLRQKTGTHNRAALMAFFSSKVPASLEIEGTDAPSSRQNSPSA
jgi:DNA-binding CsgD family transcriptional regulator